MNKLVSVVITTYKRDIKYVKEAVYSVVNQTYSPLEVIVVDDNGIGSKYEGELKKLCRSYNNVKYCPNAKNSGAQVSRNNGIKIANGEYLAFLDDDDVWSPEKIEKQMKLFTDESIGMVYCDGYSFVDGDMLNRSAFREASIYEIPISYSLELFNDYIGSTSQALIKREVFGTVGMFDVDMPARQDYEMWLRISQKYKIVGCPEKLLFYRVHPGERISTNWKKCYDSYNLLLKKHFDGYNQNRYSKSKIVLRLFSWAMEGKKYDLAIKHFINAMVLSPRCVFDVITRRVSKKTFSDFYNLEKLKQIGIKI